MMNFYNRYASKHYQNRPFKAFMLIFALILGWFMSYLADQLYAYTGAVIVVAVVTKHILEYIEMTYEKRDQSVAPRDGEN
ncbi:hypothetical protein [Alkalimonas amylolytica]|uniref:Uncharacterized protein n=1 Tax=Alkalimonas amylolytica TaxID=152573 RepID=A0A1H4EM97_ALKAM|nr:hypothetical protein [Alkalimonas amylolytica]SEA85660.1 hypothetical protein SAMN04488051_107108 [Alkalimonas amylolytica]